MPLDYAGGRHGRYRPPPRQFLTLNPTKKVMATSLANQPTSTDPVIRFDIALHSYAVNMGLPLGPANKKLALRHFLTALLYWCDDTGIDLDELDELLEAAQSDFVAAVDPEAIHAC
jgi:hypothetical protein